MDTDEVTSDTKSLRLRNARVALGKHADNGYIYHTDFTIDVKKQHHVVWHDILLETLCPGCKKEEAAKPWVRFWLFISSEPVLLNLHILCLILGVLKATIHNKAVDERLHIAESFVETVVAIAQITIRMVSGKQQYNKIKEHRHTVEVVDGKVQGRGVRRWLYAFLILGFILILFCIACVLAFFFIEHMEWTILSNNFALVVATVTSNLLLDRISHMISVIREDQHKAVIYESVMLLTQSVWTEDPQERRNMQQRVDRFIKALNDTPLFDKPSYMDCGESNRPKWDMLTTMQMQTNV